MLYKELERRKLPPLKSRDEMKEIMQREVYGYLPDVPYTWSVSDATEVESRYCCGEVVFSYVDFTIQIGDNSHTFRVDRLLHADGKKRPLIIVNNFHPMESSHYFPREELSEYDADYLLFCYTDISSDDGDFTTGLAPLLLPDGQVNDADCGKIAIWAWAAMRVLDYGLTLSGTDAQNVAIAGHSRLGKTALYTAMTDERFKFAFSNAAGCAGDSLAHGSTGVEQSHIDRDLRVRGENIADIVERFPYWFCKNYFKYAENNISDIFDQHYLLAAVAPRYVAVGACDMDYWADPQSQQMCCLAASEMWEKNGLDGLVGCDRYLKAGEALLDGHVGYFKIHSKHFFSRHSWKRFIEFIENHKDKDVNKMDTIEQISKTYVAPYKEARTSCRAIVVKDNKILLSHESKTGFYMSPGGSLEEGENFEECVIRELMEETGYKVKPVKPFVTVDEYCYDILYISRYYICEIVGEGERALTETEIYKGMVPKWVELEDAVEIFSTYPKQTPDKESLYLREFTIINRYLQSKK